MNSALTRRSLLAAAAALALPAMALAALPEATQLLVPGPAQSVPARWAARAAVTMARGLPQAMPVQVQLLGGPDGVTAANRFATLAALDGGAMLALAGAAAHARLIGDSRAKFDLATWMPVSGAVRPPILVGRGALPHAGMARRVGLPAPEAPETAALLALDLLGVGATPVFGLAGEAAQAALAHGTVDAIVVPGLASLAPALQAQPWLAFSAPESRDPSLAELPVLGQLAGSARAEALAACRAGMAAAGLRALLVLPALTPADTVAQWRRAAQRWQEDESRDGETDTRTLAPGEAATVLGLLCPSNAATQLYRDWLARRLSWRAS